MSGRDPMREPDALSGVDTIVARLGQHAAETPDAPAVVSPARAVSYRELRARVAGCAAWLREHGVAPGEVVGVTISDDLDHLVVALGLASLGAAHATLPSFDPSPARARFAARVGARRVVGALAPHRLPGLDFASIEAGLPDEWSRRGASLLPPPNASTLFTYFTTSGTTGESKIIPVLHGQLAMQSARARVGRALSLSSIEHHYAKRQFLYAIHAGATAVARGASDLPVARLCAELRVDVVGCMNAQARELVAEAARSGRLPANTVVRTSGSRGSAAFRRDLLAHVCDAVEITYSMQECGSIACAIERRPEDATESVGWPHAGVLVEVVDEHGAPLPAGQAGEIRIRAPGMAQRYLDDERANARHFRDGWLHPGDLATFAPDGSLVVHGRADDVMNLNGIKIAPAEIERVLERHPAVRAVVAFAQPSPVHGELPVAAVELAAGARADERDLLAYARAELGLRAPRRVVIVPAMPSNVQGKVDRQRLAEMCAAPAPPSAVASDPQA